MSFQSPSSLPSFGTNREQEDNQWKHKRDVVDGDATPSGQSRITSSYAYPRSPANTNTQTTDYTSSNGSTFITIPMKEKIAGLINGTLGRELPMYKDKPHYPLGRRRSVWSAAFWQGWKCRLGALGLALLLILWWTGMFSSSDVASNRSRRKGWLSSREGIWEVRREMVRQAFITSWDDYAKNAWGTDIYSPLSGKGKMMVTPEGQDVPGTAGIGWIIADGLDTAMIMNLTSRVAQARQWIKTSLDFSQLNGEISTFETTIRVLGGLLSAHYLSTTFPHLAPQTDDDRGAKGEDLYIEKAVDLADRLLGAFDTKSGVPWASINLNTSTGVPYMEASTAEATTLALEFKYVSKLTGETFYWQKAEEVMRVVEKNKVEGGLVPIFISPMTGKFQNSYIRLGSRGDSYYEYLIKQFLQTGNREVIYNEMWEEALAGIKRHLISFSKRSNFTILGERSTGLGGDLSGKMDHLVCFLPGAIALAVTGGETVNAAKKRMGSQWGRKQEEDLVLAEELMKTCYGMYAVTPSGLAAEITYMIMDDKPRRWVFDSEDPTWRQPRSTVNFVHNDHKHQSLLSWRKDFEIHELDRHNLQRPETLESLFYMYRITRDEKYRQWGWHIYEAFEQHTAIYDAHTKVRAYTSIDNVMETKDRKTIVSEISNDDTHKSTNYLAATGRDNMEGFWLAETLKYAYLLFSDENMIKDDWFDLSKVVVNTEAHFFPRFDIADSKVFKTGWSRYNGTGDEHEGRAGHTQEEAIPEMHSHAQFTVDDPQHIGGA